MTIEAIVSKFRLNGYRCTRDMNTLRVVITPRSGFARSFNTYREAYQFYFK